MNIRKLSILILFLIAGLILINGCKKKSEPTVPKMPAAEEANQAVSAVEKIEQTECPVMGGKINKDIFVEYQGKKVYFCCAECKEMFLKDPNKFLNKLPQFSK